jgi:TolB protein
MHQWDNELVKAFTNASGSFGTSLVFGSTLGGGVKAIWQIGSDGEGLQRLATSAPMAIAPAIAKGGIYYAGVSGGQSGYQLFRIGSPGAVLQQTGQVYGVAFGGGKMAVVVARDGRSDIYVGNPDGTGLAKVTDGGLNTHPSLSPAGQLAYSSNKGGNPQIYVDGRRVSARGTYNLAPSWCASQDGARVVFMGRDGSAWDVFSTDASGSIDAMQRLTQDQGSNTYPACSPDGRSVAFFSTRDGGGLYTSDVRGQNQRKLANVTGESLRWEGN